jgi:hypothetical protein
VGKLDWPNQLPAMQSDETQTLQATGMKTLLALVLIREEEYVFVTAMTSNEVKPDLSTV